MYVMKISFFSFFGLGCVCFGWKLLPEMLFRKWGCLVGPENSIFRKLKSVDWKKKPLTTEIVLHFYFPFKVFPENERERERESVRARSIAISRPQSRRRWSRSPVRDLQSASAISSPSIPIEIAKRIEIAIDGANSRRSRSREEGEIAIAPSIAIDGAVVGRFFPA